MTSEILLNDARTRTLLLRLPPAAATRGGSLSALELLQQTCDRLEDLADALEQFHRATLKDAEDRSLRRWADRIRTARSALQLAQTEARDAEPPMTLDGLKLMKRLKAATERTRPGEAAIHGWEARPAPPLNELMNDEEGVARIADHLLLQAWDPEVDVVLLFGADTAQLARELASRGNRRIVVYLREDEEYEGFPDRVFTVRSHADLAETLQLFTEPYPRRLVAKHLLAWPMTSEEQAELAESVTDLLERLVAMQATMKRFGPLWSSQSLTNLPQVARWPSIASLRGPLNGLPMLIIAPGPSLSKNIRHLRELKGRAVLCTYSRALKSLADAGVMPDLVLVLDPLDLRYHFDGFPVEEIETLVLGLSVNPGLYHIPAKRVFTFSGNSTTEQWIYGALGEEMFVQTSCSVATSALSMARAFGCDPVILVGQDLSFPNGQLWDSSASDGDATLQAAGGGFTVTGLSEHAKELERSSGAVLSAYKRLPEVRGYYGGTVQTSPNFSWVRAWFEERAHHWGDSIHLINSTEGGAYIDGMEHIPLSESAARIGADTVDVGAVLDGIIEATDFKARCRTLLDHIRELQRALVRSSQLSRRCLELSQRDHPTDKVLRKLSRLEQELVEALGPTRVVISLFGQVEIIDAQERARTARNLEDNLTASRELFKVIRDAHEKAYPALEKAANSIEEQLRSIP